MSRVLPKIVLLIVGGSLIANGAIERASGSQPEIGRPNSLDKACPHEEEKCEELATLAATLGDKNGIGPAVLVDVEAGDYLAAFGRIEDDLPRGGFVERKKFNFQLEDGDTAYNVRFVPVTVADMEQAQKSILRIVSDTDTGWQRSQCGCEHRQFTNKRYHVKIKNSQHRYGTPAMHRGSYEWRGGEGDDTIIPIVSQDGSVHAVLLYSRLKAPGKKPAKGQLKAIDQWAKKAGSRS